MRFLLVFMFACWLTAFAVAAYEEDFTPQIIGVDIPVVYRCDNGIGQLNVTYDFVYVNVIEPVRGTRLELFEINEDGKRNNSREYPLNSEQYYSMKFSPNSEAGNSTLRMNAELDCVGEEGTIKHLHLKACAEKSWLGPSDIEVYSETRCSYVYTKDYVITEYRNEETADENGGGVLDQLFGIGADFISMIKHAAGLLIGWP